MCFLLLHSVHVHVQHRITVRSPHSRAVGLPGGREHRREAGDAGPHPGQDPAGQDHQQEHSADSVWSHLHHVGHW